MVSFYPTEEHDWDFWHRATIYTIINLLKGEMVSTASLPGFPKEKQRVTADGTFCISSSPSFEAADWLPPHCWLARLHSHSEVVINGPHVDSQELQYHEVPFRIIKEKLNYV